ncbi:hypothetical protein E3N88_28275 [Mikania micrantha]|uniref:Uncharacterized protein n=1 Tax=Mikania micrantha TaxID=192012 RepID=A0A5N6N0M4_9ASTR|nr:hypothetical protein E3N88_28275 [Mikania micrantha]
MSSDDEQVPLNILMMLTQHFQHLISEDVEELAMQLFELDALDKADSQEGSSSRQKGKQKYLNRGRKDGDARLWNDYFAPEPEHEPANYNEGASAEFAHYLEMFRSLRSKYTHIALCNDLMEHLWNLRKANQEDEE